MNNNTNTEEKQISKYILYKGPFYSRSGYGERFRDFVKAMVNLYPNDIHKVIPTVWGTCTNIDNTFDVELNWIDSVRQFSIIENQQSLNTIINYPDIFIHCNIGNAFETINGSFNIGLTAGIETTDVHASWIHKLQNIDLLIVSSEHSKQAYLNTIKKMVNGEEQYKNVNTAETQKTCKNLYKKIHVLHEGIDITKISNRRVLNFFETNEVDSNIETNQKIFNDDTTYKILVFGQWTSGQMFHDRKNNAAALLMALRYFKDRNNIPKIKNGKSYSDVAILLKTNFTGFSNVQKDKIIENLKNIYYTVYNETPAEERIYIPHIILLHGEMTFDEINYLYSKSNIMVTTTHGEGFGRPLLEFAMTGKPIIATNYSGHLDFLANPDSTNHFNNILINYQLKPVHQSAYLYYSIDEHSRWAYSDENDIINGFKSINNTSEYDINKIEYLQKNFSFDSMKVLLNKILEPKIQIIEKSIKTKNTSLSLDIPKELL